MPNKQELINRVMESTKNQIMDELFLSKLTLDTKPPMASTVNEAEEILQNLQSNVDHPVIEAQEAVRKAISAWWDAVESLVNPAEEP